MLFQLVGKCIWVPAMAQFETKTASIPRNDVLHLNVNHSVLDPKGLFLVPHFNFCFYMLLLCNYKQYAGVVL